jgi:cell division protein FtsL
VTPPATAAAPAVHPRRTVGPGRPLSVPGQPRRVSGPARRPVRRGRPSEARPARRTGEREGLVLGLIEALGRVPQSRRLERLIQGRISIALVAFALIGIVTMQLGLLKLNAGIGRTLEREALLQRENAALSIENSEMAAGDRVELRAARLGMELVSPDTLSFLAAGSPSFEASRAATALSTPLQTSSTPADTMAPVEATSGETSAASGEAPSEASSATSASSVGQGTTATSSTTTETASTTPAAGAGEAAASTSTSASSSAPTSSAPASSTSPAAVSGGQASGASEGATGSSAPTGGGVVTAPSG